MDSKMFNPSKFYKKSIAIGNCNETIMRNIVILNINNETFFVYKGISHKVVTEVH